MRTNGHNDYHPSPLPTDDVQLPQELLRLTEEIAANVHDNWARERMDNGWTYGPLNEENKTHSCLRPYDELSEKDKNIDRRVAMETLKFIIKRGYKIVKN